MKWQFNSHSVLRTCSGHSHGHVSACRLVFFPALESQYMHGSHPNGRVVVGSVSYLLNGECHCGILN